MRTVLKSQQYNLQNSLGKLPLNNISGKKTIKGAIYNNNNNSYESDSIEREQIFLLQIKQLKLQNNFLKKQIDELNTLLGNNNDSYWKRKKNYSKGSKKPNIQPIHLTIQFIFEQISTLLHSISNIFKIDLTTKDSQYFQDDNHGHNKNIKWNVQNHNNPIRRHFYIKNFVLQRKLEKICLAEQQRRYPLLLELFQQYYQCKEESDNFAIQYIDQIFIKANQLNKILIERMQGRKNQEKYKLNKSLEIQKLEIRENQYHLNFLKTKKKNSRNKRLQGIFTDG